MLQEFRNRIVTAFSGGDDMTDQSRQRTGLLATGLGIILFVGIVSAIFWFRELSKPPEQLVENDSPKPLSMISRPVAPEMGYVGSEKCTACHAQIAESYRRHPMSRSMATLTSATPIEDYTRQTSFTAGTCQYRVVKSDQGLVHHEQLSDTDGTVLYDIKSEIQHVVGSGANGRSYLSERGEILSMSSIGWYTSRGWDLSPGYDPQRHQHFSRRISEACLHCHSGQVHTDRDRVDHFPSPPLTEIAIGCERCHGPGEQHVKYRQSKSTLGTDPIVNPSRLAPAERDAVCSQCHLQGVERVLRYGRSNVDFRPGQKIGDNWTVFLNSSSVDAADSADLVTQVEQMQASRCYLESKGKMGCTSCHDPHDSPAASDRHNFYRAKCETCHSDRGCSVTSVERERPPASGSCIACHMPNLKSGDVPHTSVSDHRIPRRPLKKTVRPAPPSLTVYHEAGLQISELEIGRARGIFLTQLAEESGNRQLAQQADSLLQRSLAAASDDIPVLESLGAASLTLGRPQDAERHWNAVLKLAPQHETTLLRLAILSHDSGRMNDAKDFFERFLKMNPNHPTALFRQAHILGELGDFAQAIPFAQRALELEPRRLPLYEWLSQAHAKQGNESESRRFLELRQRISSRLTQ